MNAPADHIRTEILNAVAGSPLTSAEIHDRCPGAESKQQVYAQIHYLKSRGHLLLIDAAGTKRYALPPKSAAKRLSAPMETDDLPDHLSDHGNMVAEAIASTDLDADAGVGTRYAPDPEGDDLDIGPPPVAESHAGDEFEKTSGGCCGRCQPKPTPTTPRPPIALACMIWRVSGPKAGTITLDLTNRRPALRTSGAVAVDTDLLLEIVDLIENRYPYAA